MKKLISFFPVVALVLGVGFAFANAPAASSTFAQTKKANNNGVWVDITGQVKGTDYRCTSNSPVCTQMFDSNNNPIPGTQESGIYSSLH